MSDNDYLIEKLKLKRKNDSDESDLEESSIVLNKSKINLKEDCLIKSKISNSFEKSDKCKTGDIIKNHSKKSINENNLTDIKEFENEDNDKESILLKDFNNSTKIINQNNFYKNNCSKDNTSIDNIKVLNSDNNKLDSKETDFNNVNYNNNNNFNIDSKFSNKYYSSSSCTFGNFNSDRKSNSKSGFQLSSNKNLRVYQCNNKFNFKEKDNKYSLNNLNNKYKQINFNNLNTYKNNAFLNKETFKLDNLNSKQLKSNELNISTEIDFENTFNENFHSSHIQIYNSLNKIMKNINKEKFRETMLFSYQNQITIFELINQFKKIDKCLYFENKHNKDSKIISNLSFITYYDYSSKYEMKEEDVNYQHSLIIDNYCTINFNNNNINNKKNQDIYGSNLKLDIQHTELDLKYIYYNNFKESRRKIFKEKYFYNYYPIKCLKHLEINDSNYNNEDVIYCYYAHTENEINYHPLIFKTLICRFKNCKNSMLCYKAHNIDEGDLRIIYPYYNKDFKKLSIIIEKSCSIDNKLSSFTTIINYPKLFKLESYKILPCKNIKNCYNDRRLCYNWHIIQEKRRPYALFKYKDIECSEFISNGICKYEDYCEYAHGKYELLYHPNLYKTYKCNKNSSNIECPFVETCYGIHLNNTNEFKKIDSNYRNTDIINKKLNKFKCTLCLKLPDLSSYILSICCNNIICYKCYFDSYIESKKQKNNKLLFDNNKLFVKDNQNCNLLNNQNIKEFNYNDTLTKCKDIYSKYNLYCIFCQTNIKDIRIINSNLLLVCFEKKQENNIIS